jgi:hypothetical protein
MGAIMNSFTNAQRVDFKAVSSAALNALDFVIPQLANDSAASASNDGKVPHDR